ncbi:ATP-binding cassette domain-containing protein [Planctomyces sp. SH-PL62]|uniref:ABC transporter ATP-binding protein n=1 Tax=Planctomyces sp. SH-PL62 TaxID=1636152 RepID=UPI00078EC099|nr:ATP-binding cassette domain-containing protein [Planctomyces sp. SH-PL62]AMV36741.1 Lipoprotein-releasing system ATP-binding protein LolD [Planctomyces sp. SH-PL62]
MSSATLTTTMTRAVNLPAGGDVVIRAVGVNYAYGAGDTRTQVLFDNHLEISRGEVVIMTGPSGSGKSTLLTLIGALRKMQSGYLEVLHKNLSRAGEAEQVDLRKDVGFIFQQHNLFSSLSALENVRMATALKPASVGEMNRRCVDMLTRLGLGDRIHHRPAELSGGQKQRVAIARALVNEPKMVLADEPTASLDAESSGVVLDLLRGLADGPTRTTILLVTHDQRVIDKADRIVNMVGGRIATNSLTKVAVRIVRALAASPFLEGLGEATLSRLANAMTVETRVPGETIVAEGTECDRFYIIGSGVADAYQDGRYEEEKCYGESFGMISSYFKRPVPETVTARTEMELYVLTKDDFLAALAEDQSFETRIRNLLAGASLAAPPPVPTTP